ncbi:MAG: LPS-assembly protein LptD [Pirellulales bacterium]|nr:LPS-assembly protein LptD [Pirellulales bacterium]
MFLITGVGFGWFLSRGMAQPVGEEGPLPRPETAGLSLRRIRILPRSSLGYQLDSRQSETGETVIVLSGGINVILEGVQAPGLAGIGLSTQVGTVDIMTDRAVVWTRGIQSDGSSGALQGREMPLEIYLEGNIIFRQGERVVYADRMFYDARGQVGVLLDAELLTPLPEFDGKQYEGIVRLRATAVRQLDESQFIAQNALITTSRLEKPSYSLVSDSIFFEDRQLPAIDPATGLSQLNRRGDGPRMEHQHHAIARNNRLYVEGIPVFYWPTLATDFQRSSYYINNIRIRNDRVMGTQALVDLDAYQLLGIRNAPSGTDWDVSVDYLSERGLGWGSTFEYTGRSWWGLPGAATGELDLWGIKDEGLDNLGRGRRDLVPEEDFRGHALWRHRHRMADGWQLTGQIGWLSDRSFQEQYYEREWDEDPDAATEIELKRVRDNQSVSIRGSGRINHFFTQTQWLPRLDHYWLGQPLFGDHLLWHEHTSLGYANIGLASMPADPTLAAQWKLLPWELDSLGNRIDVAGERLTTRHELDWPFAVGAIRFVPFALGEMGHWGQDIDGNDIQRAYFQTGIRASVPFWATYPDVSSQVLNLSGLAHKMVFNVEASYADANRNYDQFPLYDSLDDDAIEEFRRRLYFTTFGGVLPGAVPLQYDARTYALRSGLQGSVTSPAIEIADDLEMVRFGMRHRWQTKRGVRGQQHIIDWLLFDVNATWFPDPNRDNFGQDIGVVDYDLRWHLGDRFTFISDAMADFFGGGLRTISGGVLMNRPDRGNGYVGFRAFDGPFHANVLTGSFAYRMTEKWVSTASASIDLADTGNIGQTFSLTRIGESLLVTVGAHVDSSKDNIGMNFMIEPRFLPSIQLTRRTGLVIPPVGAYGIE